MPKSFITLILFILSTLLPLWGYAQLREVPENNAQIRLSFSPLVKRAAPAVVNIYTKQKVLVRTGSPLFDDPVFQQFFGNNPSLSGVRERVENSLGSGVIVRKDGLIITNYHVIKESSQIKVVLSDGREFDAKVLTKEKKTDLVLLKIDTKGEALPFLQLADSDTLEVGDLVLAIGNPFGVGQTVTSGIVSALARTAAGISDYQFFIQTDAPINPGNSGGALIDMNGQLVGVNTAIYSRSGGSNGIGFAIPTNMVRSIIQSDISGGRVLRPWIGLSADTINQDMANALGLKKPEGIIVKLVYPHSPADEAGIKAGDIITHIDNYDITDEATFKFRVATYPLNQTASITVWKNGSGRVVNVQMIAPPETPRPDKRLLQGNHLLQGAVIANISPALATDMDITMLPSGVVILNTQPRSLAARLGFQTGDILEKVNNTAVTSTSQLEQLLKKEDTTQRWVIVFIRDGKRNTLRFNL